ncbi:hypothetical protein A0J61_10457, partial [Choanephora cucurbitarum]
MNKKLHMAPWL